jgi:hypothetical protein
MKMKNIRWVFGFLLGGLLTAVCLGCVSLVEITGRALDGSAFAEKKIARYQSREKEAGMEVLEARNRAGETSLIVTLKHFPAIKFRGTGPDAEGKFWVTALEYLAGNVSGWNEYSMELSGEGTFTANEAGAVFSLEPELERVQISQGKIRRYDTRITGVEALTNLRNRGQRIDALVEWMEVQERPSDVHDRKSFENYWKPVLFPEICAKRKRPPDWQMDGDIWARAEDIRWNQSYTARLFPEELRPVRDSGTLLRDWEEALEWIYLQYEWETLTEQLSRQTALKRVK